MQLPEAIAIASFVISTTGFMYKMTKDVAEIKKQVTNDIQHIAEEEAQKRGCVYERIDEIKKQGDEKFVDKDMCRVLHEQTAQDVKEMKEYLKTLIGRAHE
jgi:hypothetical protein